MATAPPPRTDYRALVDDLRARRARVAAGGPEASRLRHVARGKLLARDRIDTLLDDLWGSVRDEHGAAVTAKRTALQDALGA